MTFLFHEHSFILVPTPECSCELPYQYTWAAKLTFSLNKSIFGDEIPSLCYFSILGALPGFQRTSPTTSGQVGIQVLAAHTWRLWLTAWSLVQKLGVSLLLELNICFLHFEALQALFESCLEFCCCCWC